MKKFLFISIFLIVCLETFAQTDTVFWFAPTFVNSVNGNGPVFLRLANATNQATSVRIYTPALPGTLDTTVNILGNGNTSVNLTSRINLLTNVTPDIIKNTGIKIESQRNITAYYEVVGRGQSDPLKSMTNPEIFVLKGRNALGNTFFIPSQNFWLTDGNPDSDGINGKTKAGWYQGEARSTIDIVASQDNTTISITPKNDYRLQNGTVEFSRAPFTKTLQRGQVYTLEAADWAPNKHLGGTKVTSDKPIAITDKDDSVKEGSLADGYGYDLLGDQLVPANVVGTEYLVVRGYLTSKTPTGENDYVFMVPTEDNTYINASGVNIGGPFKAGELVSYHIQQDAVRIFASSSATATEADPSKTIYVYHVTGVENELASAILPSTNCSGSGSVTFARTDLPADALDFYVNIIVRDGGENSFSVDGTPASFPFVKSTGGWSYVRIPNSTLFPQGTHTITNSSTVFHLAIFFGKKGVGASYGYFSDFGNFKVDLGLDKLNCSYDKAKFQLENYPSISWTSNTFSGTSNINPFTADKTGEYIVTITDKNQCRSKDTVTVTYADTVKINRLGATRVVCKASDDPALTKLAVNTAYDKYRWIFQNRVIATDQQSITPTQDGMYKVVVSKLIADSKGLYCDAEDSTRVTLKSNFFNFKDLGESITICSASAASRPVDMNYSKLAPTEGFDAVSIKWFKNDVDLNNSNWIFNLDSQGEFKAEIRDKFKCKMIDSVYVNYVEKISVNLGGDTTVACFADAPIQAPLEFVANPSGNYEYTWTTDNGMVIPLNTLRYLPTVKGRYTLTATDKKFPACNGTGSTYVVRPTDSLNADWNNKKLVDCFESNLELCGVVKDRATTTFTWFKSNLPTGIVTPCFSDFKDTATYKVVMKKFYTRTKFCQGDASAFVTTVDKITVNLGADTSVACYADAPLQSALELEAKAIPTGDYDYIWANPVVVPNNTLKVFPIVTGIYKLTARSKKFPECSGTASTYVIRPSDSLSADWNNKKFVDCSYSKLKLCGDPTANNFTWYKSNELIGVITPCFETFKDTATFRVVMKKFYTLDKKFCQGDASAFVKHYEPLQVGLNGADTAFCFPYNEKARVTATAGYSNYIWMPNSEVTTNSFIPKRDGWYNVKVTNTDNCSASDSTKITLVPQITLGLDKGDVKACWYSNYTIKPGEGYKSYEWKGTDALLPKTQSTYVPTKSGSYFVKVTTIRGGCQDSGTVNVDFINPFNINLGGDRIECNNKAVNIPFTDDDQVKFDSYAWFYNDRNSTPIIESNTRASYSPPIPEIPNNRESVRFTVYGRAEVRTCYAYDDVDVTYFRDNIPRPSLDIMVCIGTPVDFAVGDGFDKIVWQCGSTEIKPFADSSVLTTTVPCTYTADLTSRCGIKTVFFNLQNFKEIGVDLGVDTSFCVTETFFVGNKLDVKADRGYTYTWTDLANNAKITNNVPNSKLSLLNQANLSLSITDTNQCNRKDSIVVTVNDDCFKIPNLITPGKNDGNNDVFFVRGMFPNEWAIEIYNRWGDRVYKNETYNNEWGSDNVNSGVYFYSLKNKKKSKEYKGWVQVVNN